MNLYGIEWPPGWVPPETLVEQVVGQHVMRWTGEYAAFRVRKTGGKWRAEYLTRTVAWEVATDDDPLVACGLCLLFDTTHADLLESI